jgi:hypothetical protein
MPAAKSSKSSTSRASRFKEPAALKKLNRSLDAAQQALSELRKDSSKGAGDVYKDLRGFVSSARRDTGKLGKALAKDFEAAQKRVSKAARAPSGSTSRRKTTRAKSSSTGASRSSGGTRSSRSAGSSRSRSSSSRSSGTRSSGSRARSSRSS